MSDYTKFWSWLPKSYRTNFFTSLFYNKIRKTRLGYRFVFLEKKTKNWVIWGALSIISHTHLNIIKSKLSLSEFASIHKIHINFSILYFGKIDRNWSKNVHLSLLHYVWLNFYQNLDYRKCLLWFQEFLPCCLELFFTVLAVRSFG